MSAILTLKTMPKTCDKCPLFVNGILGHPAFCVMGSEYSDDEIANERNGNLNLYYHGCLRHRPESCPLKEGEKE